MIQDALAGSQPTASLGDVLQSVAERLQTRFAAIVHDLPLQTAESRPGQLLQYLHDARQQLLRAAALVHDTRKLPPLTQLVQPGGVLDIAATHARSLQTTADELFGANDSLRWQRVQLFNVPDALDVLSTGTYSNLPSAVHDMRGPLPAQEQEQQRLLNQLNHLLYANLLKAHLPQSLQLVEVTGGYAVLRCPGLYEAQLSLQQLPYPVQVGEARQAAEEAAAAAVSAAAAGGDWPQPGQLQQQQPMQEQQQQQQAAAGADAPAKPEVRWQWKLTHLVVLPNAGNRQPLRPEQMHSLVHHLQQNMWAAADSAAVEAAKQQGAAAGGQALADAGKGQQPAAAAAAAAQPAMSGMVSTRSGPAASTVSGLSGAQGDAAGLGLQLNLYGADEVSLPLRVMHAVLRDTAALILLREVDAAATQLAAAGSKWHTHLRPVRLQQLKRGIRLLYWQQAPALLSSSGPAAAGTAAGAAGAVDSAATGAAGAAAAASKPSRLADAAKQLLSEAYPAIEIGTGCGGTVEQLHFPPLLLPGSQQQQLHPLLDSHTADVVGLMLQGVQVIVANQLQYLYAAIQQRQQQDAAKAGEQQEPGSAVHLRLCRYGHLRSSSQQQQQQHGQLVVRSQAAATAAAGYGDEEQQQQLLLLQQLPDTLEVLIEGQSAVTVSFQPWSGRLVLRPGSSYGGDCNIEMGMSLHQHQEALRIRQDRLFQQLQQQLQARSSSSSPVTVEQHQQAVVLPCMRDLASGLSDLCSELVLKQRYTILVTAARMLSLQHSHHLRAFIVAGQQQLRLPQSAGAAARAKSARGMRQIYLSMPSMQLPPYMMLLATGAWCGAADVQQQQDGAAVAAVRRPVPARLATLSPVLCMSFPRKQMRNTDGLMLVLCNAEGLPGPLIKELRLPATQQQQHGANGPKDCPAAAAVCRAGDAAGCSGRKRHRDEMDEQPQQQQPQQDMPPPVQQQQQCLEQLIAAVGYSRARLTYEQLLLELTALQVCFEEVLPLPQPQTQCTAAVLKGPGSVCSPQQQQQELSRAPIIKVVSIPGVDLFQQLQRPCGCSPAAVGLQEVWMHCGPGPGQWSVELSGSMYSQQQQPAGVMGEGPLWHWQYDCAVGGDVRAALLQLQRLLHMQRFLNRLELLVRGRQQLDVVQSRSDTPAGKPATIEAGSVAAADARPFKKARRTNSELSNPQQQQQDGLANGPSAVGLPLNGMLQPLPGATSNGQLPSSNGIIHAGAAAADSERDAVGKAAAVNCNSSSGGDGGSKGLGLLWHWPGTGLVRLAGYSCFEAVLQCSRPLQAPAEPAGDEQGRAPQQQQQQQQKVEFHVCWQPLFGFGIKPHKEPLVQPSVGQGWGLTGSSSSNSDRTWPSSSNTTMWVDVHANQQQQQQRQAGPGPGADGLTVVSAEDVLAMGCCVSSSNASVPQALLAELASMADCGCEDLLLDAVAMLGWPLSQLHQLLSPAAPARIGAMLAKAAKQQQQQQGPDAAAAAMEAGTGGGSWWPSVVASSPAGTWLQLRVTVGAEAAAALTTQPQSQHQQQQGEVSKLTQAASAAPRLRFQLLLDFCMASEGRVKMTVRQLKTTGGRPLSKAAAAASIKQEDASSAAAAAAGMRDGADYAPNVILAALQHLRKTQQGVMCAPTFGGSTWQRQVVPQHQGTAATAATAEGHTGKRDPLSGLWVSVKDLDRVLSSIQLAWSHHVVKASTAAAAAAAAAEQARSAAAAAATGQSAGAGSSAAQLPGQQQQQQQQGGQVGTQQQQPQVQVQVQMQAQTKSEQQQPQQGSQGQQGQVLQPQQQLALEQHAAAAAKAAQQQQQMLSTAQQQGMAHAVQVTQGGLSAAAAAAAGYAAVASAAAPGAGQAMAASMPAGPGLGAPRPFAVSLPMQQQGLMPMAGVQYMQPVMAATAAMVQGPWTMAMHGMPQQQQHPAQQQQQQRQ